jgi:hypothetical protein
MARRGALLAASTCVVVALTSGWAVHRWVALPGKIELPLHFVRSGQSAHESASARAQLQRPLDPSAYVATVRLSVADTWRTRLASPLSARVELLGEGDGVLRSCDRAVSTPPISLLLDGVRAVLRLPCAVVGLCASVRRLTFALPCFVVDEGGKTSLLTANAVRVSLSSVVDYERCSLTLAPRRSGGLRGLLQAAPLLVSAAAALALLGCLLALAACASGVAACMALTRWASLNFSEAGGPEGAPRARGSSSGGAPRELPRKQARGAPGAPPLKRS